MNRFFKKKDTRVREMLIKDPLAKGIIGFSVLVVMLAIFLGRTIGGNSNWINIPFHAVLESFGAMATILIAVMFFYMVKYGQVATNYRFLGLGFFSMGILDFMHAVTFPGNLFVFLHTAAALLGAVCIIFIWIGLVGENFGRARIVVTFLLTALVGLVLWRSFYPMTLPVILTEKGFPAVARNMHIMSSVLFILTALYFLNSFVKNSNQNDILFFCLTSLLGVSGFIFEDSYIWSVNWWLLHIFREGAFFLSLVYFISQFRRRALDMFIFADKIASEKTIESQNKFLNSVINSLVHPFCIIDVNDYSLVMANSAAKALGAAGVKTCHEFSHHSEKPCSNENHRCPLEEIKKTKKPVILEHLHIDKDNNFRNVEVQAYPVMDEKGNVIQMIEYTIDITEKKQAAEILSKAHDELEQKVKERTVSLAKRTEELERSNKELEQFAYVASHDLQEPLRMVASYTQLLERRYNEMLDEKGRKYIFYAVDGSMRMQQLINDLLAFSRVGTKGKEFKEIDVNHAYEQAIANLEFAIKENNAQIYCDKLPVVIGDVAQFVQLFQNLIGNAIKFHGEKQPEIKINVVEKEKEWLFSVADNGIGLDEKYKDRIFIIFQRLHTKAEYKGTGIGLAVCKKIVERHGGRIWVESKLKEGSIFYFTIPKERRKKLGQILIEDGLITSEALAERLEKQRKEN